MSNNVNAIQSMAKLCVSRPAAAISAMKVETPESREKTLVQLRVYPAALWAMLRADNLPQAWKPIIESELEMAGFKVMT